MIWDSGATPRYRPTDATQRVVLSHPYIGDTRAIGPSSGGSLDRPRAPQRRTSRGPCTRRSTSLIIIPTLDNTQSAAIRNHIYKYIDLNMDPRIRSFKY